MNVNVITPSTIMTAAAVMLAFLVGGAQAEIAGPLFKFVSAETTVPKAPAKAVAKLLLEGSQLGKTAAEPQEVKDAGAGRANYTLTSIEHSGSTRHWIVTAAFEGDVQRVADTHYMTFTYGGTAYALAFKVSESSTPARDWTVVALATDVSLHPGDSLPISISTKDFGANDIHISQSALVGQPDGRLVEGGWVLCREPGDPPSTCLESVSPASKLSVEANKDHTFWLRPRIDGSLVGKYVGNVLIASSENPGGTKIPFTVYGTSRWRQIWGIVVIALSVVFAWVFGTVFHKQANLLQMVRPFAALRSRVQILDTSFRALPEEIRVSAERFYHNLKDLADDLNQDRLTRDGIVPKNWWSAVPDALDLYKSELARQSDRLALLEMVMDEGLERLAQKPPSAGTPAAAHKLGEIANDRKIDPAATGVRIEQAISRSLPADQISLVAPDRLDSRELTVREIDLTLRKMSVWTWIVVGSVATLVGSYALVLSNAGFGSLTDYIFCVLWGFGLPAGAQQLGQASIGTVTTALQVTAPKA
jgi:hypothetical protein